MSEQWWIDTQEFKTTDNNAVFVFSVANYSLIKKFLSHRTVTLLKAQTEETTTGDFKIT